MEQAPVGERLSFGDVIEADWLYDIYLRPDAIALEPDRKTQDGRILTFIVRGAAPRMERQPPNDAIAVTADFTTAFGSRRAAIVLTDDCELETLYGRVVPGEDGPRRPRGRVLLAAVRDPKPGELGAVGASLGLFELQPRGDQLPLGAIVELGRTFTVLTKSILEPGTFRRVISLGPDEKEALSQRWDGYAARHGPLIANSVGTIIGKLLDANGDPGRIAELRSLTTEPRPQFAVTAAAISSALVSAWQLEGPLGDLLLAAWEDGRPLDRHRAHLVSLLTSIRHGADAALASLGEPSWGPGSASAGAAE